MAKSKTELKPLPVAIAWNLVGAVMSALAERSVSRLTRSYGAAFALALALFVLNAADRLRTEADMLRLLKGLLIVPVVAMGLAAPQWIRDKYLTPSEPQ